MSRRPGPSSSAVPQQGRQNEYFVPRDGIDREVITADICRYLGNDALVRPGNYENPQTGQIIQGYYINAYRNLTTAMIEDLKADSSRWDLERRQQSASRNNTAGVQYRNSDTHQSRQYYGPTEAGYGSTDNSRDHYGDATPRYPGTGSGGYTGASSSYPAQQYTTSATYGQPTYTTQTTQFAAPSANVSTFSGHGAPGQGYAQASEGGPPFTLVGANLRAQRPDVQPMYTTDHYASARDPRHPQDDSRDLRDSRGVPVTTMQPSRTTYATAGSSPAQAYPPAGSGSGYYQQGQPSGNPTYVPAQPTDPFYGRASPAGTTPYATSHEQPQYENNPGPSRTSTATASAQVPTSGTSTRHRERERETIDRHSDSRHGHRNHRR